MPLLRTREAREDNPYVVLAPGGRVDCRSPTEKARRAVIPEREATLSTPKVNQLTPLRRGLQRRRAGVGCGKDDCSGSFRGRRGGLLRRAPLQGGVSNGGRGLLCPT